MAMADPYSDILYVDRASFFPFPFVSVQGIDDRRASKKLLAQSYILAMAEFVDRDCCAPLRCFRPTCVSVPCGCLHLMNREGNLALSTSISPFCLGG